MRLSQVAHTATQRWLGLKKPDAFSWEEDIEVSCQAIAHQVNDA